MADNAICYGFRPRMPKYGDGFRVERRRVATAYASAVSGTPDVNVGDPVSLVSDGTVAHSAAGGAAGIYGVVMGFLPYWNGTFMTPDNRLPNAQGSYGTNYARETFVLVLPVVGYKFEIDCDENTTATTYAGYRAFIGENCDHVFTAAAFGNGTGVFPRLDISTHVATTAQWRVEDVAEEVNLDFSGNYVKLVVSCNIVQEAAIVAAGV